MTPQPITPPDTENRIHVVYKTINMTNMTYYIGRFSYDPTTVHGRVIFRNYKGNGLYSRAHLKQNLRSPFRDAVRLHGWDSFQRFDLFYTESKHEADEFEAELLPAEVVNDPMCLNSKRGGKYGKYGKQPIRHGIKLQHKITKKVYPSFAAASRDLGKSQQMLRYQYYRKTRKNQLQVYNVGSQLW